MEASFAHDPAAWPPVDIHAERRRAAERRAARRPDDDEKEERRSGGRQRRRADRDGRIETDDGFFVGRRTRS